MVCPSDYLSRKSAPYGKEAHSLISHKILILRNFSHLLKLLGLLIAPMEWRSVGKAKGSQTHPASITASLPVMTYVRSLGLPGPECSILCHGQPRI